MVQHEAALIDALKRRDPAALTAVFEAHSDQVYRLALSVLHDEQQADGVVQDTFVKLIEAIDTFEGRASIGTWLYRVAYNGCMGRLRKAKPDISVDEMPEGDFMPGNFTSWDTVPDSAFASAELRQHMDRAIATLSPALRAVFSLRDVEGLSTAETASALGVSEAAVKVRLHRARLELRERLADYYEEYVRS